MVAGLAAIFVPGVGLVIGGGSLAMALGGALATAGAGAIAGGALGFLKDQGVPDHAISTYNETFAKGGAILAITLPEDVTRPSIDVILNKYNAQNIGEYGYVRTS